MRARGLFVAVVMGLVAVFVVGCGGGSGAPDVSGGSASDSATLFKASNLTKVLSEAKSALGGSPVTVLKIEPRDVKVVGQSKTVTVDAAGKSFVVSTPSIAGGGTFDLGVVSPATVESVVGAVESKASLKQSDIAYVAVAVDPINNKPFYGVYPVSGNGHYQATISGSNVKAFGGSSGAVSSSGSSSSGGSSKSSGSSSGGSNSQAIANCVSKAGTDPSKIAACTGG